MDLIFHGPLGMELSLDKSAGRVVVKAAAHDSPALLVVGRALTGIVGVPVGAISEKKSWLAVVAKLQTPERPLSLTFEAPVAPLEVDPVAAEERRVTLVAVNCGGRRTPARARARAGGTAGAHLRLRRAAGVRAASLARSPCRNALWGRS